MRKAYRKPYPEKAKDRIRQAKILNRLIKHFNGEQELSQSQVNVGLRLLGKLLPDLKAVEQTGEVTRTVTVINAQPESTAEEWEQKHKLSGNPNPAPKPH
jgi:hypothetical protein